tara:strand:+ start:506 stop:658 length:153 start_codon:yes stop_codon:yes gene_type:complete
LSIFERPTKSKEKIVNDNVKDELIKLKNLFDDGLLPFEIYLGKVNQLMGL